MNSLTPTEERWWITIKDPSTIEFSPWKGHPTWQKDKNSISKIAECINGSSIFLDSFNQPQLRYLDYCIKEHNNNPMVIACSELIKKIKAFLEKFGLAGLVAKFDLDELQEICPPSFRIDEEKKALSQEVAASAKNTCPDDLKAQSDLIEYIFDVINTLEFQRYPKEYMDRWIQRRVGTEEYRIPEDPARVFCAKYVEQLLGQWTQ